MTLQISGPEHKANHRNNGGNAEQCCMLKAGRQRDLVVKDWTLDGLRMLAT
jgi:hypothetical protein